MTEDALPEVPGYRFEAKLAEGGMGVVYRAVDDTLGRTVAIKMIRSALLGRGDEEEETVARFLREARAAAQIRSNHVAHVLQFGRTDSGDLFLVLEYLDGVTLADVLRKEKRLSVERAVRITRQICRGMEAAHQLGIVHRDLKPSNVMLVDQDGDPEFVKILDFGVAKVVGERESGVTRAGMLVGTYTCMAPEQVINETIDARTDVYALAVMLFRLLTGKPLFEGTDVTAVLFHHVHTPAPAPSKVAPEAGIPPALDAVVLRALEKQPGRRPRSMADLDRALGLSLEIGGNAEAVLQQAPTAVSSQEDETRTSYASREPTAEADDGEVFAESGPIRSTVDPGAATQITNSSSLPAPGGDPPTPHTSTSSREPVSLEALGARTGDPLVTVPEDAPAPPKRKPVAAAIAVVVLLLVVVAAVALGTGGEEDDVVVVVSPAAVEVTPPPQTAPPPPASDDEGAKLDAEDAKAATDEAATEREPPSGAEEPDTAAADSDSVDTARVNTAGVDSAATTKTTAKATAPRDDADGATRTPKRVTKQKPSGDDAAGARDQKRRKVTRKKPDEAKPPTKASEPTDDDKKPRPRFIRVRTGETDG